MSFDLNVLFEKLPQNLEELWINSLKEEGIKARFPEGMNFETHTGSISLSILEDDLDKETNMFVFEYYISNYNYKEANSEDSLEEMEDKIKEKLSTIEKDVLLTISDEDEEEFKLIAKALAKAVNGIISDPQEGTMYLNDELNDFN